MRTWTKRLYAAAVIALALGSWTVTRAGADDETDAPAPRVLPRAAFLTGAATTRSAVLEGVEVGVQEVEGGYELTFVNPSSSERALRWQLECSQVRGSPLSRIGAISVRVHEELVELRLPPGGRTTRTIALAHPAAPSELMLGFGAFASMRLLLRPLDADAAQLALLTVPARERAADAEAASPVGS